MSNEEMMNNKIYARIIISLTGAVFFGYMLLSSHSGEHLGIYQTIIIFALAILLGTTFYQLYPFERRAALSSRRPVPVDIIYERYFVRYKISKIQFLKLWALVAGYLRENPEILSPEDRFEVELKSRSPLDDSTMFTLDSAIRALKKNGCMPESNELQTLKQLILLLFENGIDEF